MKKLFFTALLAASVAASALATEKNSVNTAAVSNFESLFSKATAVKWTEKKDYLKATFVLDNVRMEALYSPLGDLIGTTKGITLDELPVSAKRTLAKKFGSFTVKEAVRFEGADEGAYFIYGENEKETLVLKVSDDSNVSTVKSIRKQSA